MFLLITFSLCVSFVYLIVQPFVLSKFSKILKLENLKFKSVFRINLLLVAVQLLSLVLSFTLAFFNRRNSLLPVVISILALVLQIGIIKSRFNAGILKSIALYVSTFIDCLYNCSNTVFCDSTIQHAVWQHGRYFIAW